MTRQGTVEAATRGGADACLISQQIDGRLALADSQNTATRVHLATIPSVYEALRDLGTFAFVASHLFYAGRRPSLAFAVILHLIEKLEDIQTKVQGMI